MGFACVSMLADHSREVEIFRLGRNPNFLPRFAGGALMWRFAGRHFQFASGGTPETLVGLFGSFEQEDFVRCIKGVDQRGNPIGKGHEPLDQFQFGGVHFDGCRLTDEVEA